MSLLDHVILTVSGVASGALNVLAAGGAVVSFLVLTGLGMPAHVANAVNLAATPASFLIVVPRTWRDRRRYGNRVGMLVVAVVGTVTGAGLFLLVPAQQFQSLTWILLVLATLTLIAYPLIKRKLNKRGTESEQRRGLVLAGVGATSVYAGFFGGGVGVLILVVFTLWTRWRWKQANATKNVICLLTSMVGLLAYSFTGLVDVRVAVELAVGMAAEGWPGDWMTNRLPRDEAEDLLQRLVSALAAFAAGVMVATS